MRKVQIGTGMGAPGFAAIVAPDLGHPQAVQAIMRQSGQVAPPFARVPLDGVKMAFGVGAGRHKGLSDIVTHLVCQRAYGRSQPSQPTGLRMTLTQLAQ